MGVRIAYGEELAQARRGASAQRFFFVFALGLSAFTNSR